MTKALPRDESGFYQRLRDDTIASIFWERLELKTDSGFPDTHFVIRDNSIIQAEGTVELKFQRTSPSRLPDLHQLMKPTQKANFLEYSQAGGRRRWLLCCNYAGTVHLYTTQTVVEILLRKRQGDKPFSSADLDDDVLPVRTWLPKMLEM